MKRRRVQSAVDRSALPLALLALVGLALRLLVWRWHEQFPLGGDEREYFDQALALLQGKGYVELPLMRPPLYTVFLAVVFRLFDSQVQRVRLVQAIIGSGIVPLVWLWTRAVFADHARRDRIALIAAGIAALCFTFAANATELLTETLFVCGLTLVFWLIVRAGQTRSWRLAAVAGLTIGALCLLRSVALPLVPLGAAWLLIGRRATDGGRPARESAPPERQAASAGSRSFGFRTMIRGRSITALALVIGALAIVMPWTIRNTLRYGTLIVIDTTGAENLWLDNDAAGREAVKRQLYALGNDRGLRQELSIERGRAAILSDPARFAAKAWGEAQKFVALEYFDDLRARRAIWVPPLETWLRLVLGDGIWLLVLLGGSAGLWLVRPARVTSAEARSLDLRWLVVPWALYVFATGLLFHVEIRYRLPLYPALLPYAAWTIAALPSVWRRWPVPRSVGAALTIGAAIALILLHRPYIGETAMLARKHWNLWSAQRAWLAGDRRTAHLAAERALALDPDSALARVVLGASMEPDEAQNWWREAIDVLPAHPYAHLLLGNALRDAGNADAARPELAFETASLENLQRWSIDTFDRSSQPRIDIGDGLDLGAIDGFWPAQDGARWTKHTATITRLIPGRTLMLRLRSPRPAAAPAARVEVLLGGQSIATLDVGAQWQEHTIDLPDSGSQSIAVTLRSATFRPRDYDRASPDNRDLGVEVDWAEVR